MELSESDLGMFSWKGFPLKRAQCSFLEARMPPRRLAGRRPALDSFAASQNVEVLEQSSRHWDLMKAQAGTWCRRRI